MASLPVSTQSTVSATLGSRDSRYQATAISGGFHFSTPGQHISADFTSQGASVTGKAANWRMNLTGYGYGNKLTKASRASIQAHDNRVDYHRKALTEWYVNGPMGLEQGFTLNDRPGVTSGDPLTLKIALSGNVTPRVDATNNSLVLAYAKSPAFHYSGLTAFDAEGKSLKSWMEVQGSNLLLRVDDRSAQYPLTVDPYVQTVILSASDSAVNDEFGYSVAFNDDYAVIGAPGHAGAGGAVNQGAVYVFASPTSATSKFTAELTASNGIAGDNFGWSVSIAPNDTIAVGAPFVNTYAGAVYTYAKPSGGFKTTSAYTAELTNAFDGKAGDALGYSVAIAANTIVAGAPGSGGTFAGYAVTYDPASGTTGYYGTKLIGLNEAAGDYFGSAVAAFAYSAAVGAPDANNYTGAAYLYEPFQKTVKFTAPDGVQGDHFGNDVSVDGTGSSSSTVAVGSPYHPNEEGAVYIYTKPAGGWTTTSVSKAEITAPTTAYQGFGYSISLSNGVLAVGAPGNSNFTGYAYAYLQPGAGWVSTSTPYASSGPNPVTTPPQEYFGWSVRVAPNGNVLVGAPYVNPLSSNPAAAGLGYVFDSTGAVGGARINPGNKASTK